MKKKNRELMGKMFAVIVVLIMIFQVMLPLFNSMKYQSASGQVEVNTSTDTENTPEISVTPSTSDDTVTAQASAVGQ